MPDRRILEEMIESVGTDGLRELFDIFKADALMRLDEIKAQKNTSDELATLKRHAHSLKGVCRTYGLPLSGDLAFDLEQAADEKDPAAILKAADKVLEIVPGEIEEGLKIVAELTGD